MISADLYFELTTVVGPAKGDPRVDLSGPTGRPVEGFFDFGGGGSQRKQKRKETGPTVEKEPEPDPWPWVEGQTSRLSRAQHIKYMQFHAQELMGEPINDPEYNDLANSVCLEQTRFSQVFRDWSQQQSSRYYSDQLKSLPQRPMASPNPLPLESRFSLFERINAKLLANASQQETRRVTSADIKAHMQACLGKPQIIPEDAFNELIDVSLETFVEQCDSRTSHRAAEELPLHMDPCVTALARHPNVAFAATFEGLLGLLSCARADTQANCGVPVQLEQLENRATCVFIGTTLQPPNVSVTAALRSIAKEGCLEILQHQSVAAGSVAIATHSTVPYNDNESRSMGAVAQALLQKAVHSTAPPSNATYLYELVELGSLRGVVRVQADLFVGDVQGETVRMLSESLFHSNSESTQEGQGLKPVILRPEPDRFSAFGGEQMTQDQCLAAWLASIVCPQATVCSPRICTTSNRLLRLEWTTPVQSAATASMQTGQLGEMLEACLLHLLSNAMCLPKGAYLYVRLHGTSTIDVLRQNEAGETLRQHVLANPQVGELHDYPLIPPKWVPRASQAPYTFPVFVKQPKEQKGNKKHKGMRK